MYLQALLSQALRTLGHPREAENSIHFSYEMVALSHATARELGYAPPKRRGDEAVRRGLGPQGPRREDRRPARPADGQGLGRSRQAQPGVLGRRVPRGSAAQIAVAAIRYFMLKFSRGKLIVFDIEEALSFEGETGPYLQYAVVRANNIFQKLKEREGLTEADVVGGARRSPPDELDGRRGRRRRPLGAGARGVAARRGRRAGRAVARVLGRWPSTRSGWRSCSTRSTIAIRS